MKKSELTGWICAVACVVSFTGALITAAFCCPAARPKPCACEPVPAAAKPCGCSVYDAKAVADAVFESYVEVRVDGGIGSGTLVRYGGNVYIVTAAHVTDGEKVAHAYKRVGDEVFGITCDVLTKKGYLARDAADVAVIKPRKALSVGRPVCVVDSPLPMVRGEDVWYCGSPAGQHGTLERSLVVNPYCERAGRQYFATAGLGWYGSSGSGVFVVRGGRPALAGVMVQLAWVGPKAPLLCEDYDAIRGALKEAVDAKP